MIFDFGREHSLTLGEIQLWCGDTMLEVKKRLKNSTMITILIVMIFILSAVSSISFGTSDASGEEPTDEPLAVKRLDGVIDFYNGDKADQVFLGSAQYEYFGSSVIAGDLDADGADDYIIAAYGASSYGGEVYIYFGLKNVHPVNTASQANITITGSSRSYLGTDLAIGDFNGDGIDDLLIGAQGANSYVGEAYIFFGKTTWPEKASLKPSNADVIFKGERGATNTWFGWRVASGDLDGDGYDEVIVTGDGYAETYLYPTYAMWGKAWIWWGRGTWSSSYNADNGEYDCGIYGKVHEEPSGYFYVYGSMNGKPNAGDLNGDGADELLLSAYQEPYFSSSTTNSYGSYAGALHILEGTPGDRSKWQKDFSLLDLADGDSTLPEHHWMYSSSGNFYFGNLPQVFDMNGDGFKDLVCVRSYYSSGAAYIFYGDGTMDGYGGGTWSTRMDFTDHAEFTTVNGIHSVYVDDFDQDGYGDLYGGLYSANSYAGALWLWYGSSDWGESKSTADANLKINGDYYDYLGYYYYPNLASGDFNVDGYPDLFFGAYYHRGQASGAVYGRGAAYVILTVPPDMSIKSFELLDGDGENFDILTADAGGNRYQPVNDQIGDGVYTFKLSYNDTWTVVEVQEVVLSFNLKSEYLGLAYQVAYSPINDTFYTIEGYGGGIQLMPERSSFIILDYHNAEIFISLRITMNFLTETPFDVVASVSTARVFQQIEYKDWLHVEMDLTFDKDDVKVLRGEEEIQRGQFLSGGPPLTLTGIRVVYDGTDVSPMNDKFFLRVIDSYGRIFENSTSGGYDINFAIPTNVDSGKYVLTINIIVKPEYVDKMEDLSTIPNFYIALDFNGPETPPNLAFHADSEVDPEGRWDDDKQVWVAWDPAYDSQVGIDHYEYMIEGPGGFFVVNSTDELGVELQLAGDGIYNIYVWAVDKVNNPGARAMKTIIKDSQDLMLSGATPSYLGGQWFNSKDVNIIIQITDVVQHLNGPHIKLSTLQYAITQSMTTAARDDGNTIWKRPLYNIVQEEKDGLYYKYTLSVNIPNLVEGKNNFVWFKVMDETGNEGVTTLVDPADPNYEANASMYNPSNVWVDITSLTYTDATPTIDEQPLVENIVTASVVLNDLGAGIDASSIEYSVSRDGLTNYGGWISAKLNTDGNTVSAETVSALLFQPGSTNYIRWRARDIAGNGYTISEDFPISTIPRKVNNPPVAEISQPMMQGVYNTKDTITFDASGSSDPDLGSLSYRWVLANKDQISEEATFTIGASELERGVHVITLYISDGEYTVTDSISIYIKQHVDEVDTDNDGIPDGADADDDNDGLLDELEIEKGTNPRLQDSDSDGVNDLMDVQPLNPKVGLPDEREGEYSYWDMMNLFLILGFFIVLISMLVIMKRRSTMQKDRVMRNVVQEGKIMQRYEVLTGIEAPLLPQVKEMGVSLPPVSAQQVAPIKRAASLTETPNLPPTAEPAPEQAPEPVAEPAQAPVEPAPSPEPAPEPQPVRRMRKAPEAAPGAIPTPEELTTTAALPGEAEQTAPGQTTNCDLCGSAIDVPAGAGSVECPLCGEKKNL